MTVACKFYCGLDHEGAHGAAADVLATLAVLDAQVGYVRRVMTEEFAKFGVTPTIRDK